MPFLGPGLVAAAVSGALGAPPLVPVLGDDRPGVRGRFLGWQPDSSRFAYVLMDRRHEPHYFLRQTTAQGTVRRLRHEGSVAELVRRERFVVREIPGQRLDARTIAFAVGPGRTLRVVLDVYPQRLGYSVWLDRADRPGTPDRLLRGWFQEVWTSFDARLFPSPDGRWVAIQLLLETPYRVAVRFDGVRVRRER